MKQQLLSTRPANVCMKVVLPDPVAPIKMRTFFPLVAFLAAQEVCVCVSLVVIENGAGNARLCKIYISSTMMSYAGLIAEDRMSLCPSPASKAHCSIRFCDD